MFLKKIITATGLVFVSAVAITGVYHASQQPEINYHLGRGFYSKGEYEQAIPFYEKAIRKGSARREAYKELAYSYLWSERHEKAIVLLSGISREDPEDLEIKISLAEAYSWGRMYEAAIKILSEVIAEGGGTGPTVKLAEIYMWNGQPEKALLLLDALAERYPEKYTINILRGKALYYSGDSTSASKVFESLLKDLDD